MVAAGVDAERERLNIHRTHGRRLLLRALLDAATLNLFARGAALMCTIYGVKFAITCIATLRNYNLPLPAPSEAKNDHYHAGYDGTWDYLIIARQHCARR